MARACFEPAPAIDRKLSGDLTDELDRSATTAPPWNIVETVLVYFAVFWSN
jgi:hypothetical protein